MPLVTRFVYRREGDGFVPTPLAAGPWSPDAQHGGPVLGLLGRATEAAAEVRGLRPMRLTVDLMKPVPMTALGVRVTPVREGRRMALLELRVEADGVEVTRASALLLRPAEGEAYESCETVPRGPDGIETRPLVPADVAGVRIGFAREIEVRWVVHAGEPGSAVWMRLPLALVEGEPNTPLVCVATLADFANAAATLSRRDSQPARLSFINADCSLFLARPPRGEWYCLRVDRASDQDGVGSAEVALFDEAGPLGRIVQSRLANRRQA